MKKFLPYLGLAAALGAAHLVLRLAGKEFWMTQLTMAMYYAVVVLGLSLLMGYAGQVSLGHGAFFAIGGYTTAFVTTYHFAVFKGTKWESWLQQLQLLMARQDLYGNTILTGTPWAGFLLAMLLTLVIAVLIGYPALRLKGHYLAMATLGFGLIVSKLILGSSLLGASDGLQSVPAWELGFGLAITGKTAARTQNFYLAGAVLLLALWLLHNLVRSRVGRALQAIHDRETAANAMGIDTARYKLKAFVASALLAAMAGVCLTHYTAGIGPSEAGALKSVRYVALAAAGGMASLWGVATISTGITFCSLRGWFGSLDNAVFGAVLIIIISIAPDGPLKPLGQWLRKLFRKVRGRKEADHAAA